MLKAFGHVKNGPNAQAFLSTHFLTKYKFPSLSVIQRIILQKVFQDFLNFPKASQFFFAVISFTLIGTEGWHLFLFSTVHWSASLSPPHPRQQ